MPPATRCTRSGVLTRHGPSILWVLVAGAGLGLLPADSTHADWPHPRGPLLNGTLPADSLTSDWPAAGPPILWRAQLGQGYSGVVATGTRLFTQVQTTAGQQVLCLDADTGSEIWRTRIGTPWQIDGDWPGPYAAPALADDHVFYAGCFGEVGCLRASDGTHQWSIKLQEAYRGQGTEFGYACTPLVDQGRVFLPVGAPGASVIALDADTGRRLWQSGSEPASYCGSLAITVAGRRQILSYLQNVTVAHDPLSGQELWRHTRGNGYAEHASWPVWAPPYLFYSEPFREGAHVLKLGESSGQTTMETVWESNVLCNDIFSSVIVDGFIYGFDLEDYQANPHAASEGRLKCISLANGKEQWSTRQTGHCSVLTDGKRLLLFNDQGELILCRADPTAYHELGRTRLFTDSLCWTTPAFHAGRLYVRAGKQLACVYLGDTQSESYARLKQAARQTPALAERTGLFERHYDESYFAPGPGRLGVWLMACVFGTFLPTALAWHPFRQRRLYRMGFMTTTMAVALLACPLLTAWTGRLVFTWPAAIFAVLFPCMAICLEALRAGASGKDSWRARGALLVLALACWGYSLLCQRFSLAMGGGFLVGVVPALATMAASWKRTNGYLTLRSWLGTWLLSFLVFYLAGAVFILWRT